MTSDQERAAPGTDCGHGPPRGPTSARTPCLARSTPMATKWIEATARSSAIAMGRRRAGGADRFLMKSRRPSRALARISASPHPGPWRRRQIGGFSLSNRTSTCGRLRAIGVAPTQQRSIRPALTSETMTGLPGNAVPGLRLCPWESCSSEAGKGIPGLRRREAEATMRMPGYPGLYVSLPMPPAEGSANRRAITGSALAERRATSPRKRPGPAPDRRHTRPALRV